MLNPEMPLQTPSLQTPSAHSTGKANPYASTVSPFTHGTLRGASVCGGFGAGVSLFVVEDDSVNRGLSR